MNLKEEIERIKSLFTEERLFGNIIESTNPDKDNNKKIDSSEFEASGGEINIKQAKEFIRKSGNLTVLDVEDCDSTVNSIPHLKCIKEALDGDSRFKDIYELFLQSKTIGCTFQITRINAYLDNTTLNDIITEGDYNAENTKLTLTLWQKGNYMGEKKTFALLMEFNDPVKVNGVDAKNFEEVKEIRLRGSLDDSCKITNVWIAELKGNKEGGSSRMKSYYKFKKGNRIKNLSNVTISTFLNNIKT